MLHAIMTYRRRLPSIENDSSRTCNLIRVLTNEDSRNLTVISFSVPLLRFLIVLFKRIYNARFNTFVLLIFLYDLMTIL